MSQILTIPTALKNFIGGQPTDFIIKSRRNHSIKSALYMLLFSLCWNGFIALFFMGLAKDFSLGFDLFSIVPLIFLVVFSLVGLLTFFGALSMFVQKGGYFVGMEDGLVKYRKGKIKKIAWRLCSGSMDIKNKGGVGNLTLELRGGKKHKKVRRSQYRPEKVHMVGIKNVFEIEKKCRRRIQEHDPTPRQTDEYR